MSPEYAMHGHFSTKSDVFSFGVLVLEIVTGKKNSSFYQSDGAQDLLSHVSAYYQTCYDSFFNPSKFQRVYDIHLL